MATRCRIAIKNRNGSYESIYCHNDGSPEGVGSILVTYYNTEDKVRELLALGDISVLGKTTDYIDREERFSGKYDVLPGTVDYKRWRGDNTPAKTSSDIYDLEDLAEVDNISYIYVFNNGKWQFSDF